MGVRQQEACLPRENRDTRARGLASPGCEYRNRPSLGCLNIPQSAPKLRAGCAAGRLCPAYGQGHGRGAATAPAPAPKRGRPRRAGWATRGAGHDNVASLSAPLALERRQP
ncbi:hypothetical protein HMPREF0731_4017 [Pseudoroseomonas cervicalis ATCC 49957]|uniref:Uncharacterized protein n=1 Tax=Pseudoroseomonas cervicalis ATCC 49957 TaxID=525371 RepID=D5RSF5_9PROT|nr:hypothetical protein HMPREF0731_4017 [Pseudoroseomonas cervicalis ATCC 49957]